MRGRIALRVEMWPEPSGEEHKDRKEKKQNQTRAEHTIGDPGHCLHICKEDICSDEEKESSGIHREDEPPSDKSFSWALPALSLREHAPVHL